MKRFCRIIIVITLILLNIKQTYSQQIPDLAKLDNYIQNAVDSFSVPGLAVGIVKNGEVVFSKGYGVRANGNEDEVDTETLFGIASLSKAFTSASIGMLVDEGKLDWNDRVIEHLPWFKLDDSYVTRELRISDLLSHRAGLATFDGDLLWYGTNYSREEVVKRVRKLPLKNSFRSKYGYQNVMFITAGEVMKNVTGKTWEEFVQERIFDSIEMDNSTLTNSNFTESDNVAIPHLDGKVQKFISYDNSGPAASINSCVKDMLKWAQFWIDKGVIDSDTLLSKDSYNAITKSYQSLNDGKGDEIGGTHFMNTGLGWFLSDYAGRKILAHGGGLPGYLSRIIVVPEDSLGIVVFQNDMKPVYSDVAKKILDLYLNDKDEDYVAKSLERGKKSVERKAKKKKEREDSRILDTKPSFELEKYAGVYTDKMYGKAEIKLENEILTLTLLPTKELFTSEMTHWHFDTFEIKFNDPFLPEGLVTFNKSSKGKITDFTIDLPNGDFHFYNLKFIKQ